MQRIRNLLQHEAAGGVLLLAAALLALLLANSPLAEGYRQVLGLELELRLERYSIANPLLSWVNDGLMVLFFLLVGLELKREVQEGELSSPQRIALPAIAAIGGMLAPALTYWLINRGDAVAMRGWAIPTATDIAFALGVLALLGRAVPVSLKVFLVTLAIADDIGAIAIIAMFFHTGLSTGSLAVAAACCAALLALNRGGVRSTTPYLLIGVVLWLSVLQSGVHATLAGVLLALFIPGRDADGDSPLERLEADLHPSVVFGVLPLFALANCGVALADTGVRNLLEPVSLGVIAGLVLGKPVGVLAFSALAIRLRLGSMPEGSNPMMFAGIACLTGIGFTMSLFIEMLAFHEGGVAIDPRLAILLGSTLAAIAGLALLRRGLRSAGS